MAKKLQEITDAWGAWMVKQHGGRHCRFTSSVKYSDHSELKQYHNYQVETETGRLVFDNHSQLPNPKKVSTVKTEYRNGSSLDQFLTYSQSETTSTNFTWSVTETVSISQTISVQAGIPEVAEVGGSITTDLSISSTHGQSFDKSKAWNVDEPINVKANTLLEASIVVLVQDYDIKWYCDVMMKGSVAIWFEDKVALNPKDYHWLWFIPITQVFQDCKAKKIIDTSGYAISPSGVIAKAAGVFRGSQGISFFVDLEETPIGENGPVNHRELFLNAVPATSIEPNAAVTQ